MQEAFSTQSRMVRHKGGKMKKFLRIIFLSMLGLFLSFSTKTVFSESSASNFSIEAVLEQHQKDKNISYWWLGVEKGESISLKLKITNGDEENKFEITSNQAVNNSNFTLDYSLSEQESKQYLIHKKTDFNFYQDVFFDKEKTAGKVKVTLSPNEVKEITVNVKIPKEGIEGQVIGGINVTRLPKESERQQGILNVYSNVVALVMEDKDYSEPNKKNLKFDLEKSNEEEQVIKIKNPTSSLLREKRIKITIKDKQGKIVSEFNNPKTAVVPNALVNIKLNNKKKLIKGEKYDLVVNASNQNFKEKLVVSDTGKLEILENKEQISHVSKKSMGASIILIAFLSSGAIYIYLKR
jgi:hypothetical protein